MLRHALVLPALTGCAGDLALDLTAPDRALSDGQDVSYAFEIRGGAWGYGTRPVTCDDAADRCTLRLGLDARPGDVVALDVWIPDDPATVPADEPVPSPDALPEPEPDDPQARARLTVGPTVTRAALTLTPGGT